MKVEKPDRQKKMVFRRIFICTAILFTGIMGMRALASMKQPPAETQFQEPALKVDILQAELEDFPVYITGYGEMRALNRVSMAPEISGIINHVHPRLEVGEIIPVGATLFTIDTRNYESARLQGNAAVEQLKNTKLRLEKQYAIDRNRLTTMERNQKLARDGFIRVRQLFEKDDVGTRSGVEAAESAYNAASDATDQMTQAVELYPIRIRETENSLTAARAGLALALANLERCRIKAPFTGRITSVSLEMGQYAVPGQPVITLADDSILEIRTALDSRDVRKWLKFDSETRGDTTAWFNRLVPVMCSMRWTEAPDDHAWKGTLHRVVKFDPQTRTVVVAIRINANETRSPGGAGLPLVEGMFCSIEIPGQVMKQVIRLPRHAVSFKNTVHLSSNNRLKTVAVETARIQGEEAFVSRGLSRGDLVITTRLIDPLENALLETGPDISGSL
jgi:RND family efflux transporter MFP subunit